MGKTNWKDYTILKILSNEIYKGDFVHGKRTNNPTYYENVVEPIVTKELWEECQVQKKRNSKNYKRDKDYLFLQKLKCPKCRRILGGNTTRKKNGNVYYYYQCHECKITIKEKDIEKEFDRFIDIQEYDAVVNQTLLSMIQTKLDNPKEKLIKELKEQQQKQERIRKAYVNGSFTIKEYDEEQELIKTIKGTSSLVEDTKNLYLDLFEDVRIKYNEKQTKKDRKIENYFNHISNDNKRDLTCEIIIELSDMDFWTDKDDKFTHKMEEVFKEQILDSEEVVPNFKIANATIHFDESSPHLHIVGVPFKDGLKNGMEKQVGKSDVFTKVSLKNIQDKMREYCIDSFNRAYHLNYTLKEKEEERNVDINVANMNECKKFKREQKKYKKGLKELSNKTDELKNKSNEINNIIDSLKPTIINKNNFTISSEDIDKIKNYIEQTNDTNSSLRDANSIEVILKKYEDDMREHSNEVRNLNKKIQTRDERISDLENRLEFAEDTIDMLEDKVSKLQEALDYFKELWKKFIKFLQDKSFSSNKYGDLIDELHEEEIIDDDLEVIQNEFSSYNSKDDDLER